MVGGKGMSFVCERNRSRRKMTDYQEAGYSRRWMQQLESTIARRYAGTCSWCDEV